MLCSDLGSQPTAKPAASSPELVTAPKLKGVAKPVAQKASEPAAGNDIVTRMMKACERVAQAELRNTTGP